MDIVYIVGEKNGEGPLFSIKKRKEAYLSQKRKRKS